MDDGSGSAFRVGCRRGDDAAGRGHVVQQPAGRAVRRVHRTQEAPRLGQQLAHRRRAQLREVCAAVHRPEVRYVSAGSMAQCEDGATSSMASANLPANWRLAGGSEICSPGTQRAKEKFSSMWQFVV